MKGKPSNERKSLNTWNANDQAAEWRLKGTGEGETAQVARCPGNRNHEFREGGLVPAASKSIQEKGRCCRHMNKKKTGGERTMKTSPRAEHVRDRAKATVHKEKNRDKNDTAKMSPGGRNKNWMAMRSARRKATSKDPKEVLNRGD